ncbi:hypothetical protein VTN77DRAFT_7159 [Rasamsonia byssochlamydoides]|uniref:uncharacterized protein n=1 Tax=Rasamsonia byssochlamydoides TaxID=89139 RepID=UPI00374414B2
MSFGLVSLGALVDSRSITKEAGRAIGGRRRIPTGSSVQDASASAAGAAPDTAVSDSGPETPNTPDRAGLKHGSLPILCTGSCSSLVPAQKTPTEPTPSSKESSSEVDAIRPLSPYHTGAACATMINDQRSPIMLTNPMLTPFVIPLSEKLVPSRHARR